MNFKPICTVFWTLFFIFRLTFAENQCLDENGQPVDWFVLYKLPTLKTNKQVLLRRGLAYMYITSAKPNAGWTLSDRSVNESQSMLAQTLRPLYEKTNTDTIQIAYNDQPPESTASSAYGHTKGVVVAGSTNGFWLIHSVPRYPPAESYQYPLSATRYGQSMLCVSLRDDGLNAVGTQLMYNRPKIYKTLVPDKLKGFYPNLTLAAGNKFVRKGPWTSKVELKTVDGVVFQSYAKAGAFGRELYAAWVAPDLHTNLKVEAWSNGVGELPSNCTSKFHVMDVSDISFKLNTAVIIFKNSMDHSKWAVTDSNQKFICIGDINRMTLSGKPQIMDNPELKGLKRIFNSETMYGRANVSKATLGLTLVGYIYYKLFHKSAASSPPTPNISPES